MLTPSGLWVVSTDEHDGARPGVVPTTGSPPEIPKETSRQTLSRTQLYHQPRPAVYPIRTWRTNLALQPPNVLCVDCQRMSKDHP